jgi:hypothetical protein
MLNAGRDNPKRLNQNILIKILKSNALLIKLEDVKKSLRPKVRTMFRSLIYIYFSADLLTP